MPQIKYSFSGFTPSRQPIEIKPMFATTSTSDSGRTQFGKMENKVMFSNEAYKITFPPLYADDMYGIFHAVMGKSSFSFTYFSVYYGEWRTAPFYVANMDSSGICAIEGRKCIKDLTFQVTAINPL